MDCLILTLDLAEIPYVIDEYVVYIDLSDNIDLENSFKELIKNNNLCSFTQFNEISNTYWLSIYEPIKYDNQNNIIKSYLENNNPGYHHDDFYYEYFEYYKSDIEKEIDYFEHKHLNKLDTIKIKKKGKKKYE